MNNSLRAELEEHHNLRILEQLGRGSTREVYTASFLDPSGEELERRVVKIEVPRIQDSLTTAINVSKGSPNERELRRITRLKHKRIIRPHGYIRLSNNTIANIEEYFPSRTLADLVSEQGPLDTWKFDDIFDQVIQALAYAESEHVFHRDIKPDNILVNEKGEVRLVDFANAGLLETTLVEALPIRGAVRTSHPLLLEALVQQKPAQATSGTERYSLGATMFYALTGEFPADYTLREDISGTHLVLPNGKEITAKLEGAAVQDGRIDIGLHNTLINEAMGKIRARGWAKKFVEGMLHIKEGDLDKQTLTLQYFADNFGTRSRRAKEEFSSRRKGRLKGLAYLSGFAALSIALSQATFVTQIDEDYRAGATPTAFDPSYRAYLEMRIERQLEEQPFTYEPPMPRYTPLDHDLASALIEGYQRFGEREGYGRELDINTVAWQNGPIPGDIETMVLRLNFNLGQFDTKEEAVIATVIGYDDFFRVRALSDSEEYFATRQFMEYKEREIIDFTLARYRQQIQVNNDSSSNGEAAR